MGLSEQLMLEHLREVKKKSLALYQAWDKTKAISIKYDGAEATATAQVVLETLVLKAPAGGAGTTLDLTLAANDTLQKVVNVINAMPGWHAALGDQFDGPEASTGLTVNGAPVDVKKVDPVWFAQDTNVQMVVNVPAAPIGSQITFTGFVGKSTYAGGGTSTIEIYDGATKVWSEPAGATTVIKESLLKRYTMTPGNAMKVKVVNSVEMTAGEMSVAYEIKDAQPFTV